MSMLTRLIRRVLRQSIDTSTPGVQAQVESLADEVHREVEVLETYGVTACPPDDVPEGLAVFVGGEADHAMVLGWLDRIYRPRGLKPGEVALYSMHGQRVFLDELGQLTLSDKAGSTVLLAQDGTVTITPAAGQLTINANVTIDGTVNASGDVVAGSVSLQGHVHPGVQSGQAKTGKPS